MRKALEEIGRKPHGIVVRRSNVVSKLRTEIRAKEKKRTGETIFMGPLVDPAANIELADETVELIKVIMEETDWDVRLLSKSPLITRIEEKLNPEYRPRVIYGVSVGILDDNIGRVVEENAPLVSKRLAALKELQAKGCRTFVMLCPVLPLEEPAAFAKRAAEKIDFGACEHVWGEALNSRGEAFDQVIISLERAGFADGANSVKGVIKDGTKREQYARDLFEALAGVIPATKFRFLQYVSKKSKTWWLEREGTGAVLLGKHAKSDDEISKKVKKGKQFRAEILLRDADRESSAALKAGDNRLNDSNMKTLNIGNDPSESLRGSGDSEKIIRLAVIVPDDTDGAPNGPLSPEEQVELAECEGKVHAGLKTVEEIGEALTRIHDKKLYRAKFKTFVEYCEKTFQFSRSQGIRLIKASAVVKNLKSAPIGTVFDVNSEAQVRPIANDPPAVQLKVAQKVKEQIPDRPPTAKEVEAAKCALFPETCKSKPVKTPAEPEKADENKIIQYEKLHKEWRAYVDFLDEIKSLLEDDTDKKVILAKLIKFQNGPGEMSDYQQEAA